MRCSCLVSLQHWDSSFKLTIWVKYLKHPHINKSGNMMSDLPLLHPQIMWSRSLLRWPIVARPTHFNFLFCYAHKGVYFSTQRRKIVSSEAKRYWFYLFMRCRNGIYQALKYVQNDSDHQQLQKMLIISNVNSRQHWYQCFFFNQKTLIGKSRAMQ